MFFEQEHFSAHILTVDRFRHDTRNLHAKARTFSALAIRLCGDAHFRFGDGTELTSRQGDVIYLPHGLSYDAEYTDMEVLAFHFRDGANGGTAENYTPRTPEVARLFEEAEALWRVGTPDARMEATALFYKIIAQLASPAHRETGNASALSSAVAILNAEYTNPDLTLPAVCERAGISESAFRRQFGALYGKPPIKYLTELRLAESQRRLIATRETVEQVALACGFCDVKYFSRVFKRHLGCTPRELRTL
ncbi:MAG: helix-turn-helix transcriptional regulator [Clostridia bacterium]|nr:helix-turn-helix transcriptional regulator [Clostridia bacterium]